MPKVIQLTLLTKPGCHLCDEAKLTTQTVAAQFLAVHSGVAASIQVRLDELNILEDQDLFQKYAEEIPVLQINGETHAYWRIDPERLNQALEQTVAGN